MLIDQIYTGCLAQGAYYIECNGEAAIIDPLRDTASYIQRAHDSGAVIKYILETHFHADFVSGHLDLSRQTGAEIIYGPNAQPDFPFRPLRDGEELSLGRCRIRLLHTPGHTMESSCYLLKDEQGIDRALFTGDTLFIGDVGRPDLAQALDPQLTPQKLAGLLFDSLQNKILPLRDSIVVYPGHGAGSACGKNLGAQRYDTLGHQKRNNYALRPGLTKDRFIAEVTAGLTPPPGYFPANVILNKKGYTSFEKVLSRGRKALTPAAFEAAIKETAAL
ncbi:MAG TPA: MBL fold metallo-hydrolase, partial [Puia sp.]|nr:MBL fold metallo-hydrolase [Puia sp.]